MDEGAELWRNQCVVGNDLPDLSKIGLERTAIGSFDLWASPELPLQISGPVIVIGHAALLSGAPLVEHFADLSPAASVATVAERTLDLAGRFLVAACLDDGLRIIVDSVGSKRAYLSADGATMATLEILLQVVDAPARPRSEAARRLHANPNLAAREFSNFGVFSPWSGYRRLLPNRVANLSTGTIELCGPASERVDASLARTVDLARQTATALATLGPIELGLTGGFDSRLALAAFDAADVDVSTFTFVGANPKTVQDAESAEIVAAAVGRPHMTVKDPVPDPRILEMLTATQTMVRSLPHILGHLTWLSENGQGRFFVNGNSAPIVRTRYGYVPPNLGRWATARIVLGHDPDPHDVEGFDEWWDDRFATAAGRSRLPPTVLFYWEQRGAIWGSHGLSEKDLFIDEASFFSSGRFLQAMLSFPQHYRSALRSSLFLDLISELSPRLGELGAPTRKSWPRRVYHLTPAPLVVRSIRPGWGEAK